MAELPGAPEDALSISMLLQLDKVCRRFEAELEAGNEPDIEAFLADTPEPRRSKLRTELEAVLREHTQESEQRKTLAQFVQNLVSSGLMSEAQVQTVLDDLSTNELPQSADDLAKLLHRKGHLTRFQTRAVYRGKTSVLVLGNYVVLDRLGSGGMGQVYKAEHRLMERLVALKVLPDEATASPAAMRRFQREAKAAAKLSHPNIVRAHDADEADGIHFLVMEYIEGQDLASLVKHEGTLSVSSAVNCILQAAAGLDYAHRQGVIHRDIKPANLLLESPEAGDRRLESRVETAPVASSPSSSLQPLASSLPRVKVLDMGLARVENATTDEESLTQTGQVMGTLDFMSPEQTLDTRHVDGRTDIYSLGCTLYYLLTGRPPFGGDSMTQKMLAHRQEPIPSLRDARSDVPEALEAVFQKMLAKEPAGRQASMAEVINDLDACRTSPVSQPADTGSLTVGPTGGDETCADLARLAPADKSTPDVRVEVAPLRRPMQSQNKTAKLPPLTRRQKLYVAVTVGVALLAMVVYAVVISIQTPQVSLTEGSETAASHQGAAAPSEPHANGFTFGTIDELVREAGRPVRAKSRAWRILEPARPGASYRVSVKHAAIGEIGAFCIAAWADTDGDELADALIGKSELQQARNADTWSSWEFDVDEKHKSLFVGMIWEDPNAVLHYGRSEAPEGYTGLGETVYYATRSGSIPRQKASPRFSNIRVTRIIRQR